MPQVKQCTREDNRNWFRVNESYVTQGVLLLQHDWVDDWDAELGRMNEGESGRPYQYPESMIRFAETLKTILRLPLRQLEGFLQALACNRLEIDYFTELVCTRVMSQRCNC
jgi:hypothetical protein